MYTSQILIISFFNTHFDSKPRKHSLKAGMSHLFLKCSGKYMYLFQYSGITCYRQFFPLSLVSTRGNHT